MARVSRAQRLRIPALAAGILLLSAAVLGLVLSSLQQVKARALLDRALVASAEQHASELARYFAANRAAVQLLSRDESFSQLFATGAARRDAQQNVNEDLVYLANLYPNSIATAGVVSGDGRELARVSDGTFVVPKRLSPDVSGAAYFGPAMSLPMGEAFNSAPYLLQDGEWVVSVATPLKSGDQRAIVHFELTLESFRERLTSESDLETAIVDAPTGRVLLRADVPVQPHRLLGNGDHVKVPGYEAGLGSHAGLRTAFAPVPAGSENANRWLVEAAAPSVPLIPLWPAVLLVLLGLVGVALLLIAARGFRAAKKELSNARDEALSAARVKSEFLATMSHEIRTPMNGVIGLTGLLLDTELSERQRQFASGVRSAGESLLSILNDILDFSKIEAGRLELEVTDFELDLLVEETAELMAQPAQAKGVELVTRVPATIPRLMGDPSRLRQVLLNLLSNAVKFTDEGEVIVSAELEGLDEDVAHVRFSVQDTGIGVSEENRERVFGSFAQADASTTRRYGGTGLGLAICRRLVHAMGGDLTLDSRLGEGSTFSFSLALPLSPETETEELDDSVLARSRLLVVDDNHTNRVVISELLTAWGARHDAVEGGPQALEALHAAQRAGDGYTVVLLDMFMPDMDGMELARRIRAEVSSQVQMVLLTSAADLPSEEAKRAGIAITLPKPIRAQWLHRTLVRLLSSDAAPAWSGPPRVLSLAPAQPKPGPASRGRVLVAEDNGVNQMVAVGILEKLGFRTDVAANGHEVLSAMERRSDYVAVLMDCQMPEMDGFEATLALREREGKGRRTPVIAMTAAAMDEDRDLAFASGMDDFVTKPVTTADLESALSRWALEPPAESVADKESGDGADASPIDASRLAELRVLGGPDGALMKRLFSKFGARGRDLVTTMQQAVAQEDAVVARAAAHELAGAAANVGAVAVARQCAEVGTALRAGDFASADAALLVLEDTLREATEHLSDLTGRS